MKRMLVPMITMTIVLSLALSAHALLIDRGGGMIYSTDMDVTWLMDANYARTTGYDTDGYMTWLAANTWAQDLSYGGYDDWRLPTFDPAYNRENVANFPAQAAELSELAYLRYGELQPYSQGTSFDPSPFINLIDLTNWEQPWYWSGTTSVDPNTGSLRAWRFDFSCG